jgi:ATP-dependent Clp protease adaptor protein ClpS
MGYNTSEKEDGNVMLLDEHDVNSELILFNDDLISFDHVIVCLIQYCKHSAIQAEQCALIVHTKGKASIKHGSMEELNGVKKKLDREGLTTEIH